MVFSTEDGRARLGVRLTDVTSAKMQELKLGSESGAVVSEVEEGSPAAKAGLAANDVILEFDGERVRSVAQLRRMVQDTPPDRTVAVKISRAGQVRTFNVKLEAAQADMDLQRIEIPEVEMPEVHVPEMNFNFLAGGPRLGISADDLTPQLAEHLGVTQGKGVFVLEVTPGSPAEKAGLKAGDCIVKVGNKPVESVADLHDALDQNSSTEDKRDVTLSIVREKREQTLSVQLEASHRMRMTMPRRIAGEGTFGPDPGELISLKESLRASMLALQSAQKELNGERQNLIRQQRKMLDELRKELNRTHIEPTVLTVD